MTEDAVERLEELLDKYEAAEANLNHAKASAHGPWISGAQKEFTKARDRFSREGPELARQAIEAQRKEKEQVQAILQDLRWALEVPEEALDHCEAALHKMAALEEGTQDE